MDSSLFQRVTKALADPRRLAILEHIAHHEERCCSSLLEAFPISQPTMSHHLKELANANLVDVRREAKFGYYTCQRETLRAFVAEMNARFGLAGKRS
jgi:ArsR family transcriptional regulator